MQNALARALSLALFLMVSITAAQARTKHQHHDSGFGSTTFDRHAIHSIGSEALIGELAARKVRTVKHQQRRWHKRHAAKHLPIKDQSRIAAEKPKLDRYASLGDAFGIKEDEPASSAAPTTDLLAKARRFIGGNPTGWRSLWCGRFMALIAPIAARRVKNPNWARDWAELPKVAPKPGAIVVLRRGRGGHIGVLDRFDRRGNPVIISGNHGRKVGIGTYPRSRVIAYVSAAG